MRRFAWMAALAWACGGGDGPGFSGGGSATEPPDGGGGGGGTDTAPDTGDTGGADTGDTGDTGMPEIVGTGYGVGDTVYDLEATTQAGTTWSLHDQYGSIVVVVLGHAYDVSMVEVMGYIGSLGDAADGVVAVPFVGYDEYTAVADQSDAQRWASEYGISTVLFDPTMLTWQEWAQGSSMRTYLVDRDMTIAWVHVGALDEVQIRDKVQELDRR